MKKPPQINFFSANLAFKLSRWAKNLPREQNSSPNLGTLTVPQNIGPKQSTILIKIAIFVEAKISYLFKKWSTLLLTDIFEI